VRWAHKPLLLTGVVAALVAAGTGMRIAQASAATDWVVAFSHHYGATNNQNAYLAVVAPAAGDVWALGGSNEQSGSPVAVHYTGGQWEQVALPSGLGKTQIVAASAAAANDIWAVTSLGTRQYALTWNGSAWSVAHTWRQAGHQVTGVTAFSPDNVWVFGANGDSPGIGTWHFNGSAWTEVQGAATGLLTASALSPDNIWAAGAADGGQQAGGAILNYNGTSWQQVPAPPLTGEQVSDVLAISDSDVWGAGYDVDGAPLLAQYNGSTWTSVAVPWKVAPVQMAADGAGGLWLIGTQESPPNNTYLLHLSASGTWTRQVISPERSTVSGLALVPGGTTLVGAGTTLRSEHFKAAVYLNGTLGS
jgi:hypothetical protein